MAGIPDTSAPAPIRGFARRLKELRAQRALTQQELADALHISKSSVNMYERGEREPGLDTLAAIADYFGVDMNHLLGKAGSAAPAEGPPAARRAQSADMAKTPQERRVLLLARRAADLPQAQYDRLVKNFEDTIGLYLEAMGIPPEDE